MRLLGSHPAWSPGMAEGRLIAVAMVLGPSDHGKEGREGRIANGREDTGQRVAGLLVSQWTAPVHRGLWVAKQSHVWGCRWLQKWCFEDLSE